MGDSPGAYEVHRTTIEMIGPIDKEKFEAYKKELRACVERVAGKAAKVTGTLVEKEKK